MDWNSAGLKTTSVVWPEGTEASQTGWRSSIIRDLKEQFPSQNGVVDPVIQPVFTEVPMNGEVFEFSQKTAPRLYHALLGQHDEVGQGDPSDEKVATAWVHSDEQLAEAVALAENLRDVAPRVCPPELASVEVDLFTKFGLQAGAAPGWFMPDTDLIVPAPAAVPVAAMKYLCRLIRPHMPAIDNTPGYPEGTMHAGPDFSNSWISFCMHMIAGTALRKGIPLAEMWGLLQGVFGGYHSPHTTVASRAGPVSRGIPALVYHDAKMWIVALLFGLVTRRRIVHMVPTFANYGDYPEMKQVKSAMQLLPTFHHGAKNKTAWKYALAASRVAKLNRCALQQLLRVSTDFKGYDKSVADQMEAAMAEHILTPLVGAEVAERWRRIYRLPIVSAHPSGHADQAWVQSHVGGVLSGDAFTSFAGCMISVSSHLEALAAGYGLNVESMLDAYAQGLIELSDWGDDFTAILPSRLLYRGSYYSFNVDNYLAQLAKFGLTATIEWGTHLLMTYYDMDGISYPYAARILQQTACPERGNRHLATQLYGLHTRSGGMERHPLFPMLEPWLFRPNEALALLNQQVGRIKTLGELRVAFADPTIAEYIIKMMPSHDRAAMAREREARGLAVDETLAKYVDLDQERGRRIQAKAWAMTGRECAREATRLARAIKENIYVKEYDNV